MAWNEPGGDNRDPWGNRNDKGPPDLDEVLRKLQDRLGSIFGGRRGAGGGSTGGGGGQKFGAMGGSLIAVIANSPAESNQGRSPTNQGQVDERSKSTSGQPEITVAGGQT